MLCHLLGESPLVGFALKICSYEYLGNVIKDIERIWLQVYKKGGKLLCKLT